MTGPRLTEWIGGWLFLGAVAFLCFVILPLLAGCEPDYKSLTPFQCNDWREISGYRLTVVAGGWNSFDEVVCIVHEQKAEAPK